MSNSSSTLPTVAIVAAGAMGAAIAKRLTTAGCTVLTNLDGRSTSTIERAADAGMQDTPFEEIVTRSDWFLSILPPSEAFELAEKVLEAMGTSSNHKQLMYADCNAISPESVKKIAALFDGSGIGFIDASIIGFPPAEGYDPTIYASTGENEILNRFESLSQYGLKVSPLTGDGAGIGDASALKMSYAGIGKAITGLFATMILAANASSPATATALLKELKNSQPMLVERITRSLPDMLPKAYRWVDEMEEISEFVGGNEGQIHRGMARLYRRIADSVAQGESEDIEVLNRFVEQARNGDLGG